MEEKRGKSRRGTMAAWIAVIVFVVYPLSMGPVHCLLFRIFSDGHTAMLVDFILYCPIIWLAEWSNGLHRLMIAYLDFWQELLL